MIRNCVFFRTRTPRHISNGGWVGVLILIVVSNLMDTTTYYFINILKSWNSTTETTRDSCSHDHTVVGFTTTYAISAYHHWCCEFESRSGRGVQHYVIKFVSDLRRVLRYPPPIQLTATIWLKQTNKQTKTKMNMHTRNYIWHRTIHKIEPVVRMFASIAVDRGFEPRSGQTKTTFKLVFVTSLVDTQH